MYKEKSSLFLVTLLVAAALAPAAYGSTSAMPTGPTCSADAAPGLRDSLNGGVPDFDSANAR